MRGHQCELQEVPGLKIWKLLPVCSFLLGLPIEHLHISPVVLPCRLLKGHYGAMGPEGTHCR